MQVISMSEVEVEERRFVVVGERVGDSRSAFVGGAGAA